jgi:hypothetical protein
VIYFTSYKQDGWYPEMVSKFNEKGAKMETIVLGGAPSPEAATPIIPPSAEVRAAAVQDGQPVAALAIEQIMMTDPAAAFEWPQSVNPNRGGVTYTPPSGDS